MKRSNLILMFLSIIFLAGIFVTDHLLALQYLKVNMNDPYKNYESLAVQPFKSLRITGGNGYAIRIRQDTNYNIRLMKSRKGQFSMESLHDTLTIRFTVASQQSQKLADGPVGLIISMPRIRLLQFSGTNSEVGTFLQDSLTIRQDRNSVTRLRDLRLDYLKLCGSGASYFDFVANNKTRHLAVEMQNTALANFHQISFLEFAPVVKDSAGVILNGQALEMLRVSGVSTR